jgi:hypothetical protein
VQNPQVTADEETSRGLRGLRTAAGRSGVEASCKSIHPSEVFTMLPHSVTSYLGASSYPSLFALSKTPLQHQIFHCFSIRTQQLRYSTAEPVQHVQYSTGKEFSAHNGPHKVIFLPHTSHSTSHKLLQNSNTKSQTHCPSSLPRSSFHHITSLHTVAQKEPHSHTPTSHHHPCTHVQPQTLKPRVLRTQSSLT